MKKTLCFIIAIILISTISISASAIENESINISTDDYTVIIVSETVETFDDGSSITTTVYEHIYNNSTAPASTTYTKSGSKTQTGTNSNGQVVWTFTVSGRFTVNPGVSATCTTAAKSYTTATGWSCKSSSISKSSNKAIGKATFVKKILGITCATDDTTCTLTCSVNGVLS